MYILKETEEFAKWYDSFKNGTPKYAITRRYKKARELIIKYKEV